MVSDDAQKCRACGHARGRHLQGDDECYKGACDCEQFVAGLPTASVVLASSAFRTSISRATSAVARFTMDGFQIDEEVDYMPADPVVECFDGSQPSVVLQLGHLFHCARNHRPTCQRCGIDAEVVLIERVYGTDAIEIYVECHLERDSFRVPVQQLMDLRDPACVFDRWVFCTEDAMGVLHGGRLWTTEY